MANYWRDFESDTLAAFPSGFTNRFHSLATWQVVDDSANSPPTGFTRALQLTGGDSSREFISLDAVDSDVDRQTVKIALLCQWDGAPGSNRIGFGPFGWGAGNDSSESGAGALLRTVGTTESIRVNQYNNASADSHDDASPTTQWVSGTTYWLVLTLTATDQTAELFAENDPGGTTLASVTVANDGDVNPTPGWCGIFSFNSNGDYDPCRIYAIEVATGTSNLNYSDAADTTAPVISSPTGTQTGATTATGTVSTDEGNGTLDAVVTTSATTPSVAQIQAGQDHTGSAAAATDLDNTVSATGVQNVSFTGLTASTTYYIHYVHQDAAGNDSNTVTSASFTTTTSATEGFTLNLNDGSTDQANLTGIHCLVWDAADPSGAPDYAVTNETTDGNGDITVDLSSVGGIAVSDTVFVLLWQPDGSVDADSLGFVGRITVTDIS